MKTPIHSLQIGMHWFPERPGGLDRIYHSLVDALPGAGVAVSGTLAGTSRAAADTGGKIEAFAAPHERLHTRLLSARRQLSRMLKVDRPDVVASHFALYTLPALDLIRRFPTVIHFHGPWAEESILEGGTRMAGNLRRKLEGTVYRRGDLHIVLSRAFGQVLETRYGVAPETIRIVPGCVEIDRFAVSASRAQARASFGLPADRPIVLSVRRLARRMGLEDLIDAVALLRKTQPEVLVAIVGKGALEADLKRRIAELGLEQHVRLLGFVPDAQLPLAYRAADLSVVPTVALEGFGLATVESLAAGTPVLVTPVGGLPEAVAELSPDLILSGCGASILADGIDAALRGQLRLPEAEACRDYARSHFDLPVIAAQVARVYQEAIERFHRRRA